MQSGDLLVDVSSVKNFQFLLTCTTIGSFSISVQPHQTLSTVRGVISEPELLFTTKKEFLTNLTEQNIIDARRISIRRNRQVIPTKPIILTQPYFTN